MSQHTRWVRIGGLMVAGYMAGSAGMAMWPTAPTTVAPAPMARPAPATHALNTPVQAVAASEFADDPIAALVAQAEQAEKNKTQTDEMHTGTLGQVHWTATPEKVDRRVLDKLVRVPSKEAELDIVPPAVQASQLANMPSLKGQSYDRVEVLAGGILKAGNKVLRLADIQVLGLNSLCTDVRGVRWTCGRRARAAFDGMLRMKKVQCTELGTQNDEILARCQANGQDLAQQLVLSGWAALDSKAVENKADDTLARMQRQAKISGAGQWAADSRPNSAQASAESAVQ